MFTCEFNTSTSVRPDLFPDLCGEDAGYVFSGFTFCKFHFIVSSERFLFCSLCKNPDYDSYSAMRQIHSSTCSLWLQGVDCMHGEDAEWCACEDDARQKLQDAVDAVDEERYAEEVDIAEQHGDRVW